MSAIAANASSVCADSTTAISLIGAEDVVATGPSNEHHDPLVAAGPAVSLAIAGSGSLLGDGDLLRSPPLPGVQRDDPRWKDEGAEL